MKRADGAAPEISATRDFRRLGLALFVMCAVAVAAQLGIGAVVGWLRSARGLSELPMWGKWLATFLPIHGLGIPAGLLMLRRVPANRSEGQRLGGKHFLIFLLMCFPIMYGGNLVGTLLSLLLSGGQAVNGINVYLTASGPLKLIFVVGMAPLLEEYVFRKQLIDRCGRYGEGPAILFSALAFALFHMNLFQFFYALGLGLVFGYVYIRSGRLRYPVLLHVAVNFMGSVVAPWVLEQVDLEAVERMSAGVMDESALAGLVLLGGYLILLLALSVIGTVLLVLMGRRLVLREAPEELPKGIRVKTVYCNRGVGLFALLCLAVMICNLLLK